MNRYIACMAQEPCQSAVRAWTRLVRAHQAAMSRVEAALKAADLPPLAWYEALVELDRAGPCGVRPFALEEILQQPQYGLSRLLARLEAAGLVLRATCPGDGRGQIVAITDAGRQMLQRMWPVFAGAVQQAVGERLSPEEADGLAHLLGRLIAAPEGAAAR
jgi:DNA-binding MarR family transcriptional regulator